MTRLDVLVAATFAVWAAVFVLVAALRASRAHSSGRKARTVIAGDFHPRRMIQVGARSVTVDSLTADWLADERPAWETVAEFEREVDRAMGLRARPRSEAVPF